MRLGTVLVMATAVAAACAAPPPSTPKATPSATMSTAEANPYAGTAQSELDAMLLAVSVDGRDADTGQLIAAGADLETRDTAGRTPLLVTGVTGSVQMAEVLLAADPDLTVRNRFGGLSHIPASERGHDDYVELVLDRTDIAVDHVNDLGWTALLEAVILGEGTGRWQRIVRSLVDHGADVAIADRDGITPLQHARARGQDEIVAILERA